MKKIIIIDDTAIGSSGSLLEFLIVGTFLAAIVYGLYLIDWIPLKIMWLLVTFFADLVTMLFT